MMDSITERQKQLGWGKSVVENLSKDIQKEFPGIQGFGVSNLRDMARFYTEYQSNEILQPLVGEISWTKHILILTKCKDTQERRFYILATKRFGWTKNVLMHQIEGKAFENYLIGQSNYDATLPESIKLLLAFGLLFYLIYQCDERYDNAQYAQKQGD